MASVYFDYMASTPIAPEVRQAMHDCLSNKDWANSSSSYHMFGATAEAIIHESSLQLSSLIKCNSQDIVWLSGATEANNLAIKGVAQFYGKSRRHIITMATEHASVLDSCKFLESLGFEVTYLKPQANGLLDLNILKQAMRPDTVLVSIMMVNNETGIIQDIQKISSIVKASGALLHVDAAQAIGRVEIDLASYHVDLMTFSSHKAYGPMGVGALYVNSNPRVRLTPQIHGGGHQLGLRSGSLPVHQIVGMSTACALVNESLAADIIRVTALRDKLWCGLSSLGDVYLNGDLNHQIPHCLNVRFSGVHQESLLLSMRPFALATGSACNSVLSTPSHVLQAMGLTLTEASNSIRISLGRETSDDDVDNLLRNLQQEVVRLRRMSPCDGVISR